MKIALLTETYFPYMNGVTTHVKTLKDGLEALGHDVLIVTCSPTTRKHYIKDGVLYCPAKSIKSIYGFGVSYPYSKTRLKYLKEFKPDIIHIHTEFSMGLFGIWAAKKLKTTLVYTLHTAYDDYIYYVMPKVLARLVSGKILDKFLGIYAGRAKAIVGPSPKCFEYIKKTSHRRKVRILPNSVELSLFNPENVKEEEIKNLKKQLNIPEKAFICCFVGRMGTEKSVNVTLDYLAKTIDKNDNIYFLAVGDGPDLDNLKIQAKNLGIDDRVIFTGKIPHEELPKYYAISKLYLTSSLTEMNSISMLEGMAMGLPVLQRVDEINKDQIKEGKNGYFFNDETEMYKIISKLSKLSDEEYKRIKFNVEETVNQKDEKGIAQKELIVYNKAIERARLQKIMKRKRGTIVKRITKKVARKH